MNLGIVLKSVGQLLLLLAVTMVACLVLGALLPVGPGHNGNMEYTGLEISFAITAGTGMILYLVGLRLKRRKGSEGELMLRREAIATVGISWIACSVYGALPYLFCSTHLSLDRALFESVSGLTTTGATVFEDLRPVPSTVLLWRSFTEWLGGMGILAMFVLVLSGIGATGRTLFGTESSIHGADLSRGTIRETTRALWILYIVLTVVCGLGLWLLGMTPFQAVNHAFTTISTGGFGTENESIGAEGFGVGIRIWLIVFMLVCGASLPLYLTLLKQRRWTILKEHEETWWYLAIVIGASALLLLVGLFQPWPDNRVDTVFNVVAIATGTGYAVGDYDQWPVFGTSVILLLMLLGGCSGSTSGGLKVSRLILWTRFLGAEVTRAFRPKQVLTITMNGRPVPDGTRGQLFVILTMAAFLILFGSVLISIFEPDKDVTTCVSAVISCVSNVGPAFGDVGPTKNYAGLSTASTLTLPLLMIFGRLEYVAVLVLLSRRLWRRY